jgi:MerR family transcriptional regulator, light-induced transcriptional regulator
MAFGIVLNRAGWQIVYLGADTPVAELTRAADARQPDLVVVAATRAEAFEPHSAALAALARTVPLILAGAGATPAIGVRLPDGDPVTVAEQIQWPR